MRVDVLLQCNLFYFTELSILKSDNALIILFKKANRTCEIILLLSSGWEPDTLP